MSIDPNTCVITGRSYITAQRYVWAIPLLWAIVSLVFCNYRHRGAAAEAVDLEPREMFVKAAYTDVLTILAGVFALLIAAKGSSSQATTAAGKIGALLENGLGMVSFFAIFGFVPGFVLRLLGRDPELSRKELRGGSADVRLKEPRG